MSLVRVISRLEDADLLIRELNIRCGHERDFIHDALIGVVVGNWLRGSLLIVSMPAEKAVEYVMRRNPLQPDGVKNHLGQLRLRPEVVNHYRRIESSFVPSPPPCDQPARQP